MTPKVLTLANGARIVTAHVPLRSVAIVAAVHVGSRHETSDEAGASHLLEHMLFKGTERYPDSRLVSKALDDLGGYLNACTSKETTCVQVQVASEFEAVGAEVAMELLTKPLLRARDLKSEKPVVCDEIRMYAASDSERVFDASELLLLGPGSAGRPVAGYEKIVRAIGRAKLNGFREAWYEPSRTAVAVVGNFSSKTLEVLMKYLGEMKASSSPPPARTHEPSVAPTRARTKFLSTKKERALLRVSFRGPNPQAPFGKGEEFVAALQIASAALGGYASARLHMNVREKRGLCYSIGSSLYEMSDASSLTIDTEVDPKNLERMLVVLGLELSKFARKGLTQEEFLTAKSNHRGSMALYQDMIHHLAYGYVQDLLLKGRCKSDQESLDLIQAVELAQVQTCILAFMQNAQVVIVAPSRYAEKAKRLSKLHLESLGVCA